MDGTAAVGGSVAEGFEPVREVFEDVLRGQGGPGASFAVWHDGAWVVDLWGGWADARRTTPWTDRTLVMPYSVTKPFAAVCALLLVERGLVGLDAPVQAAWSELRARTTLREILAHRSGLVVLDEPAPTEAFYDWELMCTLLAAQEPAWEPGTAHGESALFYGHLLGQVVRRVDGRTLGTFLREEVCAPLGLDFHVGLGADERGRTADLAGLDDAFRRAQLEGGGELFVRALTNPPGALDPDVVNGERWRVAEVPAVNGHGTAKAVAGLYAALARGDLLGAGLRGEMTRAREAEVDRVMGGEPRVWGLGVALTEDGYGMGGLGGSFGAWSERGGYAVGFLTGLIGDYDRGDRLENAVRAVLGLPPVG